MKEIAYIGIDPGASGGICCLIPATKEVSFISPKSTPIQIHTWLQNNQLKYDLRVIMIEKVHAIQGTSAGSNFNFGYNTGLVNGISGVIGITLDHVTPKTWQKYLGVTKKGKLIKKGVAEIIQRLYPQAKIYGPRGGLLDGHSDALAISHYASHKWRL